MYVLCIAVANLTATWFFEIPLIGISAVGTLVFGFVFTLRDSIHAFGKRYAYVAIALAAITTLALSFTVGTPLRIIGASFIAIVLNELADTEVYERLKNRHWIVRVMGSNAVSIPIDSVLFTLIAFYGTMDTSFIIAIIIGDTVVKFLFSLIIAPLRIRSYATSTD